jgi:hypothetical protein
MLAAILLRSEFFGPFTFLEAGEIDAGLFVDGEGAFDQVAVSGEEFGKFGSESVGSFSLRLSSR